MAAPGRISSTQHIVCARVAPSCLNVRHWCKSLTVHAGRPDQPHLTGPDVHQAGGNGRLSLETASNSWNEAAARALKLPCQMLVFIEAQERQICRQGSSFRQKRRAGKPALSGVEQTFCQSSVSFGV